MKYLLNTASIKEATANAPEILTLEQENSQYAINLKILKEEALKNFSGKTYIKATADKDAGVVCNMHVAMQPSDEQKIDNMLAVAGKATVDYKVNGRLKEEELPRLALIPVHREVLPNGMLIKFYGEPKVSNPSDFS